MTTLRQGIGLAGVLMLAFVLDKLEPETFLCVPNPLNGGQGYTELEITKSAYSDSWDCSKVIAVFNQSFSPATSSQQASR
jgi:hypothetical protein